MFNATMPVHHILYETRQEDDVQTSTVDEKAAEPKWQDTIVSKAEDLLGSSRPYSTSFICLTP